MCKILIRLNLTWNETACCEICGFRYTDNWMIPVYLIWKRNHVKMNHQRVSRITLKWKVKRSIRRFETWKIQITIGCNLMNFWIFDPNCKVSNENYKDGIKFYHALKWNGDSKNFYVSWYTIEQINNAKMQFIFHIQIMLR